MALFRKFRKELVPLQDLYSEDELIHLGRHGTIVDLPPGQTLFEEGTLGTEAAVIVSGTAKVSQRGKTIAILEGGSLVGEGALLSGEERNASVSSVTLLKIAVLGKTEMVKILAACPHFRERVTSAMDARAA